MTANNPAPYTYQINCIVHSPFLTRSLATAAVLIAQEEEHQPCKTGSARSMHERRVPELSVPESSRILHSSRSG
jgi:hypothetical protein